MLHHILLPLFKIIPGDSVSTSASQPRPTASQAKPLTKQKQYLSSFLSRWPHLPHFFTHSTYHNYSQDEASLHYRCRRSSGIILPSLCPCGFQSSWKNCEYVVNLWISCVQVHLACCLSFELDVWTFFARYCFILYESSAFIYTQ